MIHTIGHFARWTLNNQITLGILSFTLIIVPIMGMWAVHKYKWEHWEPFSRKHK
jgi:cytochrome oxidase assembly protein ShyY1